MILARSVFLLRIGIFTDSYKPYVGGVVRSIESFTTDLRKLGHDVYILAPNYPGAQKEKDVFRFPSIPSPTYNGFYLGLPFSTKLEEFLNQSQLDIIHVHSPFILGRLGAKISKKRGLPLVFTYHTLYDQYTHYVPFAQGLSKEITRKICVDFCNRCDLVITPTEIISEYITKMGVKSNILWLPTGIQLSEFVGVDRNWLKETYHINSNEIILLFVGRLGKEKNIPFIIDALKKVLEEHSHVKLFIVGDGPETENLKKYVVRKGLTNNVIFTGKMTRENLVKAYCGADIFVFSSLTETQGIVIAEAKAAGLPVVAINAFGVSDMVIDNEDGFLVSPDANVFSKKIIFLINDSVKRNKMSQNALLNAEKLSSQKSAETLIRYYESLQPEKLQTISPPGLIV